MPADVAAPADSDVKIPPTVDLKARSAKFSAAMSGEPEKPQTKPPDERKVVAQPKVEAPAEAKPDAPLVPEPKKVEAKAEAKAEPKKIPADNFKAVEERAAKAERLAQEREQALEKVTAELSEVKGKVPADLEDKMRKLGVYEQFMQRFYVEHSDQFKAAFDEKISASREEALNAVSGETKNALTDILDAPPGKHRDARIKELYDSMESEYERSTLRAAYSQMSALQAKRKVELDKAPDRFKELTAIEQQQREQQRNAMREMTDKALQSELRSFAEMFPDFRPLDGNEEHNSRVSENSKLAKSWAGDDLKPVDRARVAAWAVKGFRSAETDAAKDALISKLQAQLKELQDNSPSLRGHGKDAATKAGEAPKSGFVQKFNKAMSEGVGST